MLFHQNSMNSPINQSYLYLSDFINIADSMIYMTLPLMPIFFILFFYFIIIKYNKLYT